MINFKNMEGYTNPNQVVVSGSEAVVSVLGSQATMPTPMSTKINAVDNSKPVNSTHELRFARDMNSKGLYRKKSEGDGASLYKWIGTNWDRVDKTKGKEIAWHWLKTNARNLAKDSKAVSLYNSCLHEIQELGDTSNRTLIPLQNCWLEVTKDNKLKIVKPDRTKGVTYHVKANLDFQEGAEYYEPKPIPPDSLLAGYLGLSLPDESEQGTVQEYLGYTLLNDTRYQVAQVWVGNGCNGKSVLLKIISELHARVGSLCLDRLTGFGIVPVVDSSLLVSAETPKKGINEQELKKIVTGDPISIEYKNKDLFTYKPTGKLLIACNTFPQLNDDTDGIWRRLQIIRWGVSISKEQQITNLDSRIIDEELNLVVDWCLAGLLRLLNRGKFNEPASVKANKEAEKQNSDSVKAFVADYGVVYSTDKLIGKDKLYELYEKYSKKNCFYTTAGQMFWKSIRSQFPGLVEKRMGPNGDRYRAVNLTISHIVDEDESTPFDDMEGGV